LEPAEYFNLSNEEGKRDTRRHEYIAVADPDDQWEKINDKTADGGLKEIEELKVAMQTKMKRRAPSEEDRAAAAKLRALIYDHVLHVASTESVGVARGSMLLLLLLLLLMWHDTTARSCLYQVTPVPRPFARSWLRSGPSTRCLGQGLRGLNQRGE
jgi:hypothetical protein